mmetsp:Transcript_12036/g.13514  ORF Transcript_12036/g.13514 Transcript_12036/m.13514 type:complete len:172 (-) Transcript_12036:1-516(-)
MAKPPFAALLVAIGALLFSLMGLSVKLAGRHCRTTTFSLLAVRSFLGLVLSFMTMIFAGGKCESPSTRPAWFWLIVRSLGGCGSIILEYISLKRLPLAIHSMILYSSPAFVVVWAALLLQERVKVPVVICLCVSLCGLLLLVQPWDFHNMGVGHHPIGAYIAALVSAAPSL